MRYISWVRSDKEYGAPPQALTDAMAKAGEESFKNGTMIDMGGLSTIREGGAKLSSRGGTIVDGPYSEAKELVGGYAIQNYNSLDEAREGARWLLQLHKDLWPEWEGEVEVRQMYRPEDF